MKGRRGRWLAIAVAVLVVAMLALATSVSGSHSALQGAASSATAASGQGVPQLNVATVFDLLWKFGLVVGILGVSLWLLRRYGGGHRRGRSRSGAVAVVDTIPLPQGRALYVVDVGDRAVVVGATQQQLSALADVTDPATLARLRAVPEPQPLLPAGLARRFNPRLQFEQARATQRERATPLPPATQASAQAAALLPELKPAAADPVPSSTPDGRHSRPPDAGPPVALAERTQPPLSAVEAGGSPPARDAIRGAPRSLGTSREPSAALRSLAERLRARRESA